MSYACKHRSATAFHCSLKRALSRENDILRESDSSSSSCAANTAQQCVSCAIATHVRTIPFYRAIFFNAPSLISLSLLRPRLRQLPQLKVGKKLYRRITREYKSFSVSVCARVRFIVFSLFGGRCQCFNTLIKCI